jgi:hypothetical protein
MTMMMIDEIDDVHGVREDGDGKEDDRLEGI